MSLGGIQMFYARAGLCSGLLLVSSILTSTLQLPSGAQAQTSEPFRLGVVTALSGPFAGPLGVPARHAAELMIDAINEGRLPGPYGKIKGIAGRTVSISLVDEAGNTTKQVSEFRNLVQRQGVDAVVGYILSGNCLAVAPVAEELQALTVLSICSTPRIFEENKLKYVFRTSATGTVDSVSAARYLIDRIPGLQTFAGINQNYAYGQDTWRDFRLSMKALRPDAKVVSELFPTLNAGQYGSELSVIQSARPQALFTSFSGPDFEALMLQLVPRGIHNNSALVLSAGAFAAFRLEDKIPNGAMIGDRGPYGPFARDTALDRWFRKEFAARTAGAEPFYPSYMTANAILGLKLAADKAAAKAGKSPSVDQIISEFENMKFDGFGSNIDMAIGGGHQAITESAVGIYNFDKQAKRPKITDIKYYPANCINPPAHMKSVDWIGAGMPGANC
jgi:branched-chain amino acid transport system substrate-binding protein